MKGEKKKLDFFGGGVEGQQNTRVREKFVSKELAPVTVTTAGPKCIGQLHVCKLGQAFCVTGLRQNASFPDSSVSVLKAVH